MIPASGSVRLLSWPGPPDPRGVRSVSDSESEELLNSTFSVSEEGAIMEGRIIPSPSSGTVKRQQKR